MPAYRDAVQKAIAAVELQIKESFESLLVQEIAAKVTDVAALFELNEAEKKVVLTEILCG